MQVVLATGEGNLVCLDVTDNKLTEKAHVQLNGEVSCIDITPLDDAERSQIAAVGTWDMQASNISLPVMLTLGISDRWRILSCL